MNFNDLTHDINRGFIYCQPNRLLLSNNKIIYKHYRKMKAKVLDEERFKALQPTFTVGYSTSGYVLEYSANGTDWSAYPDAVPANEVLVVNDATPYSFFRLKGNSGEVDIVL